MPCLKIFTNIARTNIPEDFVNKIIPVLVKTVNKSAEKFTCVVCPDCFISYGGDSSAPGVDATLESIGNIGPEENKIIVKELSAFLQKELNVHPDRFFISFYDLKGYNIGRHGITH